MNKVALPLTDIIMGYVLAKRVSSIWLVILAAILLGISNTILSYALLFESGLFSQTELAPKLLGGIVFNPLLLIGSVLYFRRKIRNDGPFKEWFSSKTEEALEVPSETTKRPVDGITQELLVVGLLLLLQVIAGLALGIA